MFGWLKKQVKGLLTQLLPAALEEAREQIVQAVIDELLRRGYIKHV